MRKYSEKLLDVLKDDATETYNNGVKIIVKPNLTCLMGVNGIRHDDTNTEEILNGFNNDKLFKKEDLSYSLVNLIRNNFAITNYNLNTVPIYTK